ncbi:MarR family winged helix-turn-helix transcriptional regulator [Nocardioides caricicola]|uniref:MarR family winged helix-turn-helix transcriptional regulator n=1 Tax=Nocardioides caricicola TaxID=634770 RepID=A0ABW0N2L1_9ACTN
MTARHPQLALDQQICFPLYAASRAMTRAYADLLGPVGLTYPQYLVLLALWEASVPMSVGELGARLQLDSGTLTPLLKRLEGMGHVERRRDPDDERRVLVELTRSGVDLQDAVAEVPAALIAAEPLTLEQVEDLRRRLDEVLAAARAG